MPVICNSNEMVCESNLSGAIREALATSSSHQSGNTSLISGTTDELNIQDRLIACAKRLLINKIEYEEAPSSSTTLYENLKSKYVVLKPGISTQKPQQNGVCIAERIPIVNGHSGAQANKVPTLPKPKRILFPISNVHIGWKSSGRRWNVGSGMVNMGNTCYLNSTLQALFHVPSFASWLYEDVDHRRQCCDNDSSGCIICAMAKTLNQSQTNPNAIRPQNVYFKLKMICKHLTPGRQEDAHEFLRYLIEAMEKSYLARFKGWKEFDQYTKETTPVNQILGGYLRSAVKCLSCQHVSVTFQHFQDLLLDIRKANSIDEGVELYFARERLEDTGYKCESCKKRVTATKQFSIERAPIALCVQLKRFSMLGGKINKHISMKHTLNLNNYASNKAENRNLSYRLVSLVTHIGASQHCGHYTAIGCTESGQYYHFDDSMVSHVQPQRVLETQAYLLFYELIPTMANGGVVKSMSSLSSEKEFNMFAQDKPHAVLNKITSPVASSSSSSSNHRDLERKPGFIGPLLPQKNGNTSQSQINGTNKPLVNKILLGSKVISDKTQKEVGTSPVKTHGKICLNSSSSTPTSSQSIENSNSTTTQKPSTLPSMPTLRTSPVPSFSKVTTPVKENASKPNGFSPNPKSLVPYELDGSDSETNHNDGGLSDQSVSLMKTNTGLWHVCDGSPGAPSLQGSTDNFASRPASAPSTPSSNNSPSYDQTISGCKRSNSVNGGGSGGSTVTTKKVSVVDEALPHLLQMSHRGYGSTSVQTWNGDRTKMEKEVAEEKRDDRKRQFQEDRETEMDRGRTKKIKTNRHDDFRRSSDWNYNNNNNNAFQQQQNRENAHQNRAKWLANNQNKAFQYRNKHDSNFQSRNNSYNNNFQYNNRNGGNGYKSNNNHRNNNRRNFSNYNINNRYHNQRSDNFRRH